MPGEIKIVISGDATQYDKDLQTIDKKVQETDLKVEQVKAKSRITMSNILMGLQAISAMAIFVTAVTGEQIEMQYAAMITMGLSTLMQLKTQAAMFAATPGMQPLAMIMISLMGMTSTMIMFMKSQQMRVQTQINKSRQNQLDGLLDGVNM